jgi:hypothetical protein
MIFFGTLAYKSSFIHLCSATNMPVKKISICTEKLIFFVFYFLLQRERFNLLDATQSPMLHHILPACSDVCTAIEYSSERQPNKTLLKNIK